MSAKLQCEICGGKLIGKPGGIFECDSCGVLYDMEWAKQKIQEIRGTVTVEGTVEVTGKVQVDGPVTVETKIDKDTLLKRGMMALEDERWKIAESCFNQLLENDLEFADAYLGLAMCEAKQTDKESYESAYSSGGFQFRNSKNVKRARQFSQEYNQWFTQLDEKGKINDELIAKWVCPVCGFVHQGKTPPDKCLICRVPGDRFTREFT